MSKGMALGANVCQPPSLGASGPPPLHGAAVEVYQMPVGGQAIAAGILAHGRDEDAVLESDVAELQWRKQVAHGSTSNVIIAGMKMAVELILIRHAESEGNVGLSCDPDCALTASGFEQARQLARWLASYDLSGFAGLSSPYRRARQTAEVIADITGLSFTIDEGIREWGPATTVDGRQYPFESGEDLIKRMKDFLGRHEGKKLLVVSHAAPIAALTQIAWGERSDLQGSFWEGVGNCCFRWLKTTCSCA